ncbi:unnamed protein product [Gongylonema pulchrum]|uniref:G_PROTEIN_RECEP_F1_2 domain-containing protein n=1 Tax=Gongylonema pulchrum TaxID=637853 RepID=A0A183DYU5_9BILA|nr:unnamed protein product [Gongylonema pulchrum]
MLMLLLQCEMMRNHERTAESSLRVVIAVFIAPGTPTCVVLFAAACFRQPGMTSLAQQHKIVVVAAATVAAA